MRLITSSLLILASVAVLAVNGMPLDHPADGSTPYPSTTRDSARPIVDRMTNAKRLSMGLPPLKPKALRLGTRAASARRSGTSMLPPTPHKCNILVTDTFDRITLGYLSPVLNDDGFYSVYQKDQANSLEVAFNTWPDDPSPSELDLVVVNAPDPSLPYLAARFFIGERGERDLSTGHRAFAGIGSSATRTPPGSPPTQPDGWESAIWKYNSITQDITAQWIKSDGSTLPTSLVWVPELGMGITGDVDALQDSWDLKPVTFTCVPPLLVYPAV